MARLRGLMLGLLTSHMVALLIFVAPGQAQAERPGNSAEDVLLHFWTPFILMGNWK